MYLIGRHKKVLVYKYKPKKNERKTIGHRQDYTKVEILSIKANGTENKTTSTKVEKSEKKDKK